MTEDPVAELVWDVLHQGNRVDSRYGMTTELVGAQLCLPACHLVERRGINYSLGWMEMLQLLAGDFDQSALERVAPNADHSLFTYSMAYGPRISAKIEKLIRTLENDWKSRQAVLFIGRPEDGMTSDLPCTLTMQFLVRGGDLHGVVSMRSWDLCRGLPYDLMMFSGLLLAVGRCLKLPVGNLTVQAGSAHIYDGWDDKTPHLAYTQWKFDHTVPTTWGWIKRWAAGQAASLRKGGLPDGIVLEGVR